MEIMLLIKMAEDAHNYLPICHLFVGRLILFDSVYLGTIKIVCLALCLITGEASSGYMLVFSSCQVTKVAHIVCNIECNQYK